MEIVQLSLFDGKCCRACGEWNSFAQFVKMAKAPDGLHYECKKCTRARNANWRAINRERDRARRKDWRQANPDRVKAYNQEYHEKRGDFKRSLWRAWADRSRHHLRHKYKARRARCAHAEGHHTAGEWRALCARYNHLCLACGEKKPLTCDHIIPLVRGGTNYIGNIQPLCAKCNSRKGTQTIDYRK